MNIDSELELPWPVAASGRGELDVSICCGKVPKTLGPTAETHGYHQVAAGSYLLNVEGVIRCLVSEEGRQVRIAQETDGSHAIVYVLDSILSICMHLRDILPLRASAVATAEGAVLFTGSPGIGKSTLVAALIDLGYPLVADGIVGIKRTKDNSPRMLCGFPVILLWKKALRALQGTWCRNMHLPTRPGLENYPIPVRHFHGRETPVHAVFHLAGGNGGDILLKPIARAQALVTLMQHTCLGHLLRCLGRDSEHFRNVTAVIRHSVAERLSRPGPRDCSPAALAACLSGHLPPPA